MQRETYTVSLEKSQVKNFRPGVRGAFSRTDDYIFDIVEYDRVKLAASSSNKQIKIFEKSTLVSDLTLSFHENIITGLKAWSRANEQLLLSCSKDGYIALWDPRAKDVPLSTWCEPGNELASFDFNCEGNILAAGTYLNESTKDAKILFWDVRTRRLLRQFVESHNDDITEMRFHPTISSCLLSGGEDGLVCSFSLNAPDEDEALDKVINTGASVSRADYFGRDNQFIYSMSHCETFNLWSSEGDPLFDFGNMKGASTHGFTLDYGIRAMFDNDSNLLFYIAGSYNGDIGIYKVNLNGRLELSEVLDGGHHDVVRSIHWNILSGELFSAGEDGNITSWTSTIAGGSEMDSMCSNIRNGTFKHRFSPY